MVSPDAAESGRGAESGERRARPGPGCGAAPARGPRSKCRRPVGRARVPPGVGAGRGGFLPALPPLAPADPCAGSGLEAKLHGLLFCFSKVLLSGLPGPACAAQCVCLRSVSAHLGTENVFGKLLRMCFRGFQIGFLVVASGQA